MSSDSTRHPPDPHGILSPWHLIKMLRYAATANKRHIAAAVGAAGSAVTFYALTSSYPLDWREEKLGKDGDAHQSNRHNLTGVALTEGANPAFTVSPRLTRHPFISKEIPTRGEQMARLSASDEVFDVLVIGGGATGSGVALDAQMRGLNTALIERADFSSETSSRSTKLIWAGIRYIATATSQLLRFKNLTRPIDAISDFTDEFRMVMGAHKERRILLENNPHLTNWVPIAVPLKEWVQWPPPFGHPLFASVPLVFPAILKFYDSLSGFSCPPSHLMSKSRAKRKFPQLDEDVKYVSVFYEGQHNDARTATCIALTAAEEGATVCNYTEMTGIIRENGDKGKAVGIKCRDNLTGKEFEVRAKCIIFSGGPFTDSLRKLEDPDAKPAVAAAAGTHIVLPGYYSPAGIGLLDINTSDGRFLFFLPWQGFTIVGTTDRKGPPESTPEAPEQEIQWLLHEAEKYLAKDLKVRRSDVLSAWQGFRPLASDPNAPPGAPVSRDHIISTNPDTGITFITGGKWTTYREMAEDVLNKVLPANGLGEKAGPCLTEHRPLRGGVGYTRNVPVQLVQEFGVSEDSAEHLARTYGMNAFDVCKLTRPTEKKWPRFGSILIEGFPYLECEVEYACKKEMNCSVIDFLTLRTRLAYLNKDAAIEAAPKVADLMAKAMKWSKRERNRQLDTALKCLNEFGGPVPLKNAATISAHTIADLHALFETFDANQNGYIEFDEMQIMAAQLGAPFKSVKEARKTWQQMDTAGTGRVKEEQFVEWWYNKEQDVLRKKLSDQLGFSADKLGKGAKSRGVVFG